MLALKHQATLLTLRGQGHYLAMTKPVVASVSTGNALDSVGLHRRQVFENT